MKNLVITIGREFGSGGHEVGKRLAKKLGRRALTKNTLRKMMKKLQSSQPYVLELP